MNALIVGVMNHLQHTSNRKMPLVGFQQTLRLLSISGITRADCKVGLMRKGIDLPMLAPRSKYDLKIVLDKKCRPIGMPSVQSTSDGKIN